MVTRAGSVAAMSAGAGAVLLIALCLHGAVPFLALPTLGQAVWTAGFAQAFMNDSLLSIYAANFGAPRPAPIAFGLAGAWPTALLIAGGLHPADAYAAMTALWLSVAFVSAYRLARLMGVAPALALAGAALWLTMPIIWGHADYSMLGLGIALLPFYFLCALMLMLQEAASRLRGVLQALLYVVACLVAVFMDGYSFLMFVAGASLLGAWLYARCPPRRQALLRRALPVHAVGVLLACTLYLLYAGALRHPPAPLEAFRGWGLDLAFIAVPSAGVHWLPDALGLSVARSEERFFGDASVWVTTFALPLFLGALAAWRRTRSRAPLAGGLLLALLVGLYLALGPSLKINATKPAGEELGQRMPARYALGPTGSAWLSSTVPGLRDMRAAYRWLALSVFSGWLLLMLWLAATRRREALLAAAVAGGVAILNLPHVPQKWREHMNNRDMFMRMEAELLPELREELAPGERVAFLPYRNDFLVNYLAARLRIVSYNIGGDKNLDAARRHWPATMREFRLGAMDAAFPGHVVVLLARSEADSVVLPYVDLLWAAHRWPARPEFKEALQDALAELRRSGFVEVTERSHYAVVKLNRDSYRLAQAGGLESQVLRQFCMPPICLRQGAGAAGPHRMAPGRYRFAVYGTAAAGGWIELVSGQAALNARFALSASEGSGAHRAAVLAEGLVTLEVPVDDLEVRTGEAGPPFLLERYELVPTRLAKR